MKDPAAVARMLRDVKSWSAVWWSGDLQWSRQQPTHSELKWSVSLATALVKAYARCGCMERARLVFDGMDKPTLVSWNTLLLGYASNGEGSVALDLSSRMKAFSGLSFDAFTYVALLKACSSIAENGGKKAALRRGKEIHLQAGCHLDDPYVSSTLIDMYGKCGAMAEARAVFDSLQKPDVVCWSALLSGYAENGEGKTTLELFTRMKAASSMPPNAVTYAAALKACTCLAAAGLKQDALKRGREIHLEAGSCLDAYAQGALIGMYAKCGSMAESQRVFDSLRTPSAASWTSLILGYAANGEPRTALLLFSRMKALRGCAPDSLTYVAALKACASLAGSNEADDKAEALEMGRDIHSGIRCSTLFDMRVQNTLISMYAKCGSMAEAQRVFDSLARPSLVSRTALMLGYAENGEGKAAVEVLEGMMRERHHDNHDPDDSAHGMDCAAYLAGVKACTSLAASGRRAAALRCGRALHLQIGSRFAAQLGGALVGMYAKCGTMPDARRVFNGLPKPDLLAWNALLLGYADNGEPQTVLEMLREMADAAVAPDAVTYLAALKACASLGALALARKLHKRMASADAAAAGAAAAEQLPHQQEQELLLADSRVVTSVADCYAKCGSMGEACEVYDAQPRVRTVCTANALLGGYAHFGDAEFVVNLVEEGLGVAGDAVTLLCLLVCCSHAGRVERAKHYFETFPVRYGVALDVRHYTCMVDALARSNRLAEAAGLLQSMLPRTATTGGEVTTDASTIGCCPTPNAVTWRALLAACRKWRSVEIGRWAFQGLVAVDSTHAAAYVLMARIYASCGMRAEEQHMRAELLQMLQHTERGSVRDEEEWSD